MKINIPKPCSENWDAMKPDEKGRYCSSCCKIVIDFTGMSLQAITAFLTEHASQKICGRFTEQQLAAEYNVDLQIVTTYLLRSGWPVFKKMAAIFIFVFALSQKCNAQTAKDPLPAITITASTKVTGKKQEKADSLFIIDAPRKISPDECLTGPVGCTTAPAGLEKRKRKNTQKKELKLQKKREKQAALSGEVVVVAGMILPD